MSSPTSRTLELLRKEGWTAQVVERWNPHSNTRLDLFGGIDVLACAPAGIHHDLTGKMCIAHRREAQILGVQACAGASHSTRKAKLLSEKRLAQWCAAGGRLEVWSWSKKGPRGKRKLWEVRREALTLSDFIPQNNKTGAHVLDGREDGRCGT